MDRYDIDVVPEQQSENKLGGVRRRLSTALLYERLGLAGEWGDPDFQVALPDALPANNARLLSSQDARDLESSLEALVRLGSRKKVLYWCIWQLGPEAEAARQGVKNPGRVRGKGPAPEVIAERPAMATRQDMAWLSNKARSAAEAIKKYRDELLLLSEVCSDVELPAGMMTEAEMPEDALLLLLRSLSWVSRLADSWSSPNARLLLKSKGLLFILTYVWMTAKNSRTPAGSQSKPRLSRRGRAVRITTAAAQEVAMIAHIYLGADFTVGDLSDKLQDFATDEPALFRELIALMQTLHRAA